MSEPIEKLLEPWQTFLSAFVLASACGIAARMRADQDVGKKEIFAASLYSGCLGLVIALCWYNYFPPSQIYFLIGISGLAGLGGVSVLDLIISIIARGTRLNINISTTNEKHGVTDKLSEPVEDK